MRRVRRPRLGRERVGALARPVDLHPATAWGSAPGVLAVIALVWLVAVPALPCGAPGGDGCSPSRPRDRPGARRRARLRPLQPRRGQRFLPGGPGPRRPDAHARPAGHRPTDRGASRSARPPARLRARRRAVVRGEAALGILPAGAPVRSGGAVARGGGLRMARPSSPTRSPAGSRGPPTPGRGQDADRPRGRGDGARRGVSRHRDHERGAPGDRCTQMPRGAPGRWRTTRRGRGARRSLRRPPGRPLPLQGTGSRGSSSPGRAPRSPASPRWSIPAPAAAPRRRCGERRRARARAALDPRSHPRVQAHPGFFSAFPAFEPTLAGSLPAGLARLPRGRRPGQDDRSRSCEARARPRPGCAAVLGELVGGLRGSADVDLARDLLPSLGSEAAIALAPVPGHGSRAARAHLHRLRGRRVPRRQGARGSRRARWRRRSTLAAGAAFSEAPIGDVTAYSLRVSPTVELTYALVDSTLVVATDPAGIRAVAADEPGSTTPIRSRRRPPGSRATCRRSAT